MIGFQSYTSKFDISKSQELSITPLPPLKTLKETSINMIYLWLCANALLCLVQDQFTIDDWNAQFQYGIKDDFEGAFLAYDLLERFLSAADERSSMIVGFLVRVKKNRVTHYTTTSVEYTPRAKHCKYSYTRHVPARHDSHWLCTYCCIR